MLRRLSELLCEPVMGFLALAALCAGSAPLLFTFPAWLNTAIAIAGWVIIGLFALEFAVRLALAPDKGAYPTIIGGLLGMNVLGNPWPVTLGQVAFGTFVLMLGVLYAFMAKGWLR